MANEGSFSSSNVITIAVCAFNALWSFILSVVLTKVFSDRSKTPDVSASVAADLAVGEDRLKKLEKNQDHLYELNGRVQDRISTVEGDIRHVLPTLDRIERKLDEAVRISAQRYNGPDGLPPTIIGR